MSTPFAGLDPEDVLGGVLESLRARDAPGTDTFDETVGAGVGDCVIGGLEDRVDDPGLLPEADEEQTRAWPVPGLDAEFAAHLSARGSDGGPTDAERPTAAFEELGSAGIVSREGSECRDDCAHAAMPGESAAANAEPGGEGSPPVHGSVFHHAQDAERLRPHPGSGALGAGALGAGGPGQKPLGPSPVRRRTGRPAEHPGRRS
ncbi:hypothetical protein SUDANB121_04337 [Nocardiopsis dassonvillei]|uniref:DUF6891 domain-containing protein n=1 Tax=Nocardiopsis dassonvillei TaxID=2014 RepID=UPI003F5429E2